MERRPELVENAIDPDPVQQFRRWFDDAVRAGVGQPDAMTLATATPSGHPSARIVLLKEFDERGFVFYTNYRSRKGAELQENPRAALVFHWEPLGRQVRIEGRTGTLTPEESDRYFASRPRENQLSSLISNQSTPAGRDELDRRYEEARAAYEGKAVPRPPHWGGYRLVPDRIEFWQHRIARLNDRILYVRREGRTWTRQRLAP